jgi:UDP-glucose-4-epimerase GalE
VRWGEFVEASVSNLDIVTQTVTKYNINAVIDLTGSIEVGESVIDPIKYYGNNFACKLAFLQTLSKAGVKAFVFSSTAAVYGEPETVPIPESHRKQPKSPYGWSKLLFEQLLSDFHLAGGPSWMALRYFNAAGASFDGDIGENHQPESHLIPRACFAALGRTPALEVYGNDYPTPDGTAIRDYVHVLDLASAHILALEALLADKPPAAYNLGNGLGSSIQDILASFTKLGHPVPHSFKPRRSGDPARLVADNKAACNELGFKPRYGDVDSIISSAFKWHEKN